jgi:hypothetical protein
VVEHCEERLRGSCLREWKDVVEEGETWLRWGWFALLKERDDIAAWEIVRMTRTRREKNIDDMETVF